MAKITDININDSIRAREVRLIGATGEQLGIVSKSEALRLAENSGLDLVEVASAATPVVCKIMDFGKLKYDQKKKDQENKKKQHVIKLKEVRFRPRISEHDFEIKVNQIKKFISDKSKVKITVMYRGREITRQDLGQELFNRVSSSLSDVAAIEKKGDLEGRRISIIMSPK